MTQLFNSLGVDIMSLVSGNNSIDSLASSSWKLKPHTAAALTYSFMATAPSDASADDANGFRSMATVQMQAARDALAKWAAVANLSFTEVAAAGNIQLGTNDQGSQSSGYAYLPNGGDPTYLFTNNVDQYNSVFTPGTYGPTVLLHELGHTLGLKHPGNYDSTGTVIEGPFLPSSTDNTDFSVMSYNNGSGFNTAGRYNVTPMLYDIQAIQYLYGANMAYHTGDDTYQFVTTSAPQCIWDAGGSDTLDFSACMGTTTINLNAGAFSETAPGFNNISIAYNVTIERAVAGAGGSTIYCNTVGDVISGGGGADRIYEGTGNDQINGGGGSDTVVFASSLSHYVLSNLAGKLVVSGDGIDSLSNIETLVFSDRSISIGDIPVESHLIADQAAQIGKGYAFSLDAGQFSLGSGGTPSLSASLLSGSALPSWLHFDNQTGVFSGIAGAGDAGALNIHVTASGSSGGAIADDFLLVVSAQNGVVVGGAGNDSFAAGKGNDQINGGDGIDTVSYSGARSQYSVVRVGDTATVTDQSGDGGIDSLTSVERLQFADGKGVALDTARFSIAGETYRLYEAAFGRVPDLGGLGYWMNALDKGVGLAAVAQAFINSAEFTSTYGNLNTEQFVTQLYANVLHRAPDAGGLAYHMAYLNGGEPRSSALVAFSESVEFAASLVGVMTNGLEYIPYHG